MRPSLSFARLRGAFTRLGCVLVTLMALSVGAAAQETDASGQERLRETVGRLADASFPEISSVIADLAATGDPEVEPFLLALRAGDVYWRKSDNAIFIGERDGREIQLYDPFTRAPVERVRRRDAKKVTVNNGIRSEIDAALATLTLGAPDPAVRLAAAEQIYADRDPGALAGLEAAIEREEDDDVRAAFVDARAAIIATSADAEPAARVEAIGVLRDRGGQDVLNVLKAIEADAPSAVRVAAAGALETIEANLEAWRVASSVWQGLSLGSVLLLAAIGLAITFGVMGVINMAHGELVMLGAYTTFTVQEAIRDSAPHLFDYSLLIAAPLAFLIAGLVGVAIERGVVRFLYGRPLETLLATWGVSLILQQAIRSIYGPNNREVGNPSWMSGAFELGEMTITYNRFWILFFALAVFAFLLMLMKRTPLGLQMRAVTQNRAMAADMGVRTGWVDAMTFGLGAGVAGLAGVALSQINNVSPDLGQGYIVDSFMIVVFGGAGNLWGALAGAFTLGVANKFLEPFAGAVLGKIIVLVFIILFIQKRPRGLFAIRGRAVEA